MPAPISSEAPPKRVNEDHRTPSPVSRPSSRTSLAIEYMCSGIWNFGDYIVPLCKNTSTIRKPREINIVVALPELCIQRSVTSTAFAAFAGSSSPFVTAASPQSSSRIGKPAWTTPNEGSANAEEAASAPSVPSCHVLTAAVAIKSTFER